MDQEIYYRLKYFEQTTAEPQDQCDKKQYESEKIYCISSIIWSDAEASAIFGFHSSIANRFFSSIGSLAIIQIIGEWIHRSWRNGWKSETTISGISWIFQWHILKMAVFCWWEYQHRDNLLAISETWFAANDRYLQSNSIERFREGV